MQANPKSVPQKIGISIMKYYYELFSAEPDNIRL